MLTREAVAAALALAGIRSGAHVLDLAPAAGLTRAARAMAGSGGRVDAVDDQTAPLVRYSYALAVWSDRATTTVIDEAVAALPALAPYARVTIGSTGSLVGLVDGLRAGGWTVLHGTTVPEADPALGHGSELALVVARRPE